MLSRCKGAGSFSYTLYVVHNPMLVLAYAFADALGMGERGIRAVLWAVLALVLTEAFAYGAARIFERPRRFRELAWRSLTILGARRNATTPAAPSACG
jgi:peptidoglycan/LPS O-acetylase OafA/YrhL